MKVGFLSDLHLDHIFEHTRKDLVEHELIRAIVGAELDILIFSGDLSSDWQTSLSVCDLIESRTQTKVYLIIGNHEIWREDQKTFVSLEGLINHPSVVCNRFVSLTPEWSLYGGLGWYDYSFRLEGVTPEDASAHKVSLWPDSRFVDWKVSDPEFAAQQIKTWNEDFSSYDPTKKIIFSQHVVPRKEFLNFKENNYNWNFCNAYIGSAAIGEFIRQHPAIQVASFGHSHTRFAPSVYDGTQFVCRPVGFSHEWETDVFYQELMNCLVIKEI